MANKYDTPLESKFINTYVPIPFEEMVQAGRYKEERYDKGISTANQAVSTLEGLQAEPGSPDEKRLETYKKNALDLLETSKNKDFSNSFVINDFISGIRKAVDKKDLMLIISNKARMDKAKAAKQELAMKNLYNPALDNDPAKTWDSSVSGEYNWMPKAYVDKESVWGPVFKAMEPDYNYIIPDENGLMREAFGVSKEKVQTTAADLAAMESKTPMGAAFIEQWKQLNPGKQKTDYDILYDELLSVGMPRASLQKRTLGAALQKFGDNTSSNAGFDDEMGFIAEAKNVVNSNERAALKTINLDYNNALDTYSSIEKKLEKEPKGSYEYNALTSVKARAQGIKDKYEDVDRMANDYAKGTLQPKVDAFKAEAVNSLKSVYGKTYTNEQLKAIVDEHLSKNKDVSDIALGEIIIPGTPFTPFGGIKRLADKIGSISTSGPYGTSFTGGTQALNVLDKQLEGLAAEKDTYKNQLLLKGFNPMVSEKWVLPVEPTLKEGRKVVENPQTKEVKAYNTERYLKALPDIITKNSAIIHEIDDKGRSNVINPKNIPETARIMSTWKNNSAIINPNLNENGNLVLRVGYTPEGTNATGARKTYEIEVQPGTGLVRGMMSDHYNGGNRLTAARLFNPNLATEVKNYVNVKGGHEFDIREVLENKTTKKAEVKIRKVKVERRGVDYWLVDETDKIIPEEKLPNLPNYPFKSETEVADYLYNLQAKYLGLDPNLV